MATNGDKEYIDAMEAMIKQHMDMTPGAVKQWMKSSNRTSLGCRKITNIQNVIH